MKLSELLRGNERPQAFGVGTERVGVRRESELLRWVVRVHRIEVPTRTARCAKCEAPVELPAGLSGYLIHLNDVHFASTAVIADALEELGL